MQQQNKGNNQQFLIFFLLCITVLALCTTVWALFFRHPDRMLMPDYAPVAAEAVKPFKMTDAQRQKMREQREKFMAERKAKMEARMLETVKKYVPEEEKAKALVKELQDVMMSGRRNMMRRPPKPEGAKPAEAK